ncbi:MAG: DNA polymerase Y family protein, partial [Planctomycetes bacterium]|nr:DNA polymerase Y family protein [Planctomycetota bacterium]
MNTRVPSSRIACLELPAFPLQILLNDEPEWRSHPAVVVDEDKPQGMILWANERARRSRILPGLRYATGLSIDRELRAGVVDQGRISDRLEVILDRLWRFAPGVEPSSEIAGLFWID